MGPSTNMAMRAREQTAQQEPAPVYLLGACVRLICFAHAMRIMAATAAGLPFLLSSGGLTLGLAALVPSLPVIAVPALVVRVANRLGKLPLMHDSQWWVLQMDMALVTLCLFFRHRKDITGQTFWRGARVVFDIIQRRDSMLAGT